MRNCNKITACFLICSMIFLLLFAGCGNAAADSEDDGNSVILSEQADEMSAKTEGAPHIDGLTFESELEPDYAELYKVYRYTDGYALIDITQEGQFLLIPEGAEIPNGLPEDITVIRQPKKIYLAATALMALFVSMDALDAVDTTSLQADGWTFDEPKQEMLQGMLIYAGKYSSPDYELLLERECDLAIESTMIYHTPEVQEMMEDLGIPVLVDRSSYESNPLGRAEWIRLYAILTGHENEANAFFADQKQKIEQLEKREKSDKTVAFFYLSTDGKAIVRSNTDYVPAMIRMAGGTYVFDGLADDGKSSVPVSIETFYDLAADADILIYNQSIDASVQSIDDLIARDPVMAELKAVKEGNVWVTGSSMYQRTDIAADIILEFQQVISGADTSGLQYISKLF